MKKKQQPKHLAPQAKKGKGLKRGYIILAAVCAVLIVLFLAYRFLLARPPQVETQRPGALQGQTSKRQKNVYTFLVVGRDTAGGGNTDTILLGTYRVEEQTLNVMSLPRDTLVNVNADIKKLNAVYNYGGGGDEGIKALNEEVSCLVGFIPDFNVVVEWEAVGELVDALGGVWYDVPRDMYYVDPYQDLYINVPAGYQKLDGKQAMQVVRYRSGYVNGDLGRIETQQGFLKAVVKQCLQIENVTRIGALAQVFTDNVTTNLTVGDLAWLGEKAVFGGLDMENVHFVTMPWVSANGVRSRIYNNYPSYVAPDVDALVELINESFNPFAEPVRAEDLDIMYVNDDGTLGCTSGRLEDQNYNDWVRSTPWSGGGGQQIQPQTPPAQETPPAPEPEPAPAEPAEPESTQPAETEPVEPETPETSETPGEPEAPGEAGPEIPEPPAVPAEPPVQEPGTEQPPEGIPIL